MNDMDIFKEMIIHRLDELEKIIIDSGNGIEMGTSPERIKEQFYFTKLQIFGKEEIRKR